MPSPDIDDDINIPDTDDQKESFLTVPRIQD